MRFDQFYLCRKKYIEFENYTYSFHDTNLLSILNTTCAKSILPFYSSISIFSIFSVTFVASLCLIPVAEECDAMRSVNWSRTINQDK